MAVLTAAPAAAQPATAPERVTLRLRDVPLHRVFFALHRLTGHSYALDADVTGRVDVELVDVTPADVERALEGMGLAFSAPGAIRRVTWAGSAPPALRRLGTGNPVSLEFKDPGDVRDVLRLIQDISGSPVTAPPGPLGRVVLFANQAPFDDAVLAFLAAAHLDYRREAGRLVVFRPADPQAASWPVSEFGTNGHVLARDDRGIIADGPGVSGSLVTESRLIGLLAADGEWSAFLEHTRGQWIEKPGQPYYDGKLVEVGPERVVHERSDGRRFELVLPAADDGITSRSDGPGEALSRASARVAWNDFEEGERILTSALAGTEPAAPTTKALQHALADLRFAWGEALASRGAPEDAIRRFEDAAADDDADRPWQESEDLNEIGFLWMGLGEAERAQTFHRRALEASRAALARDPRAGRDCARYHPRPHWGDAAALNGLADSARVLGRFAEAENLYGQATAAWRYAGDWPGQAATLTGLGRVREAQKRFTEALAVHRRALAHPEQDRSGRAIALEGVARAQAGLGRRESACTAYADSLTASREYGDLRAVALTTEHLRRFLETAPATDHALDRCRAALAVPAGPR